MRFLATVGFVALVSTMGACAALSGLGDYEQCAVSCGEASSGEGASSPDASMHPRDASAGRDAPRSVDTGVPGEEPSSVEASSGEETSAPESGEVGPMPSDATTPEGAPADVAPVEAAPPPDAGIGSTCGPKGTTTRCNASQVCCANLAAQTNTCAATCAMNATLTCQLPSDCPGSAPLCCAHVTFTTDSNNDPSPKCAATAFSAACAASCNDLPPANGCTFTGIIRLCKHDGDCMSDTSNAGGYGQDNQCWNYNGAPESWCTNATVGMFGGGVHQP
jgi:hypothetical protein